MNIMKVIQCYHLFWKQIFLYASLVWVAFLFATFYFAAPENYVDDELEKTLAIAIQHLDDVHIDNVNMMEMKKDLIQRLKLNEKKMMDKEKILNGPSEGYEVLRRRIYSNTKEFWYYVSSALQSLANEIEDLKPKVSGMKIMIDEHYRSLLRDIAKLADVDGYSEWRWKEFHSLSRLVEKRLQHTQNPPDCSKAKKLLCNHINNFPCAFGCRIHHLVKCLIVAYATERTMIIDNPKTWKFTRSGFANIFLPLSDTCTSTDGKTVSKWPGNETTQVVNFIVPENPAKHPRPPYIPNVLPEDLAGRINVLHGDPAVWWIGQFLKYIFRPQPSTTIVFNEFAKRVNFQKPIVG